MRESKLVAVEIKPGIYWAGVNDRSTELFEGLWPITDVGVSYNSYIIADEKVAVIDLVKGIKTDDFLSQVEEIAEVTDIDYVVINHMEPDHTGIIKVFLRIVPNITFVGTEKTKEMLRDYYQIESNFLVVKSGDRLELGKHTLVFYEAPFVHWPETMVTWEEQSKILFSCDAFGGFGALRGSIFDDEYDDLGFYIEESLRYYANIVAKFSRFVLKAIEALKDLEIEIIAPSHGLIWRNPVKIIELYRKWAKYASEPPEKGITVIYGSMYGNTEKMMNAVTQGASKSGLPIQVFDVARTDVSYILPYLWKYQGVIIGAPTYETKLFPPMTYVLTMAEYKRIFNRKVARFGSYGWSGGAQRDLESRIERLKWELTEVFEFQGGPTANDLEKGKDFGEKFAKLLKSGE